MAITLASPLPVASAPAAAQAAGTPGAAPPSNDSGDAPSFAALLQGRVHALHGHGKIAAGEPDAGIAEDAASTKAGKKQGDEHGKAADDSAATGVADVVQSALEATVMVMNPTAAAVLDAAR